MSEAETLFDSAVERLLLRPFRPRPGAGSLGEFYYQLATMLGAGLTVTRALDSLSERCGSWMIRRRLPRMKQHIEAGGNMAGAFGLFPEVFEPFHVAMIRAGEQAGRLDGVLHTLSAMCKRRAGLTKTFMTGLLYPVFLLHFALLTVPFVKSIQTGVPYLQAALPTIGAFYGVLFVLFGLPRMLRQFRGPALVLDELKRLVPIVSGVTRELANARFARSVEGLYSSGVRLGEALAVAGETCGDEIVRRRVERMVPLVEQGMPLSRAMAEVGGFPSFLVNMVATGEEGGQLSQMLGNAAAYQETEAETMLHRAAVILPVFIYVGVAVWIGYQVIKSYEALWSREGLEMGKVGP